MSSRRPKFLPLIGIFLAGQSGASDKPRSIYSLPFTWNDDQAKIVKLDQWKSGTLVISMFYTSCRRICPTLTLELLEKVQRFMDQRGIAAEFVVATFDPASDTPKELARYRQAHHLKRANWHFLTGSFEATHALAERLGMGDFFNMDDHIRHEFRITLIPPQGELRFLDWDHRDIPLLFK